MSCASASAIGRCVASGQGPADNRVTEGVVNAAHEAVVALHLQGLEGRTQDIEPVVDTGYSGFLTLPTELVVKFRVAFRLHGPGVSGKRR